MSERRDHEGWCEWGPYDPADWTPEAVASRKVGGIVVKAKSAVPRSTEVPSERNGRVFIAHLDESFLPAHVAHAYCASWQPETDTAETRQSVDFATAAEAVAWGLARSREVYLRPEWDGMREDDYLWAGEGPPPDDDLEVWDPIRWP